MIYQGVIDAAICYGGNCCDFVAAILGRCSTVVDLFFIGVVVNDDVTVVEYAALRFSWK